MPQATCLDHRRHEKHDHPHAVMTWIACSPVDITASYVRFRYLGRGPP